MPAGVGVMLVLIPAIFLITLGLSFYYYTRSRHLEKMAMIDKGIVAEEVKVTKSENYMGYRFGMLSLGVGIGIFFANLLDQYTALDDTIYPSLIFIFGGGALVLSYYLIGKKEEQV